MKTLIKLLGILCVIVSVSIVTVPQNAKAQTSVSFQVFYDDLSPYGYWVNNPSYGYVWIPDYGPEFIPYYSNGYWAYTNYGWTWVSYYRWGWAPFHYGRWAYDNYYGWFWVPDDIWGPAWVCWRTSPGFYGWVPLGPNITFALAIGGSYNPPPQYWVFVNDYYMGRTDIYQYYAPRKSNGGYIDNSKVINNTYVDNRSQTTFIAGPKKEDVEKVSKGEIKQLSIKETNKPGQSVHGNELAIYRPDVKKGNDDNIKPAKISDLKKDVTPVSERKGSKSGVKNSDLIKETEGKKLDMKKDESKEKIVKPKERPINEEKIKKEKSPKMVEPKKNKDAELHPNREMKKKDQPPKMVQPNMNNNKNFPSQPPKEIKKQDRPPRMVQPNMNQNPNPGHQQQPRNQGGQQKKPR